MTSLKPGGDGKSQTDLKRLRFPQLTMKILLYIVFCVIMCNRRGTVSRKQSEITSGDGHNQLCSPCIVTQKLRKQDRVCVVHCLRS